MVCQKFKKLRGVLVTVTAVIHHINWPGRLKPWKFFKKNENLINMLNQILKKYFETKLYYLHS